MIINDYQNLDICDFRNEQIIVKQMFFLETTLSTNLNWAAIYWKGVLKCQNVDLKLKQLDLLPPILGIQFFQLI